MADHTILDLGTIGIVGLGNMGLALAERVSTRLPVIGLDTSPDRQSIARKAGIDVGSLHDITQKCSIVLFSLPHPEASLAVARSIASNHGIVKTVLETSTVTPADVIAVERELNNTDIEVLDAAILAGVSQMRSGNAGLLLAGKQSIIKELKPLLDTISTNRRVLGTTGTGMAAKVITNAVAHVVMVLLSEAMAMAETSNLDPNDMAGILAEETGSLMRPLTHRIAERAFTGNYEGGMPLEAARKDSVLAQAMAQDSGVPVFTIPAAHTVYEIAMTNGLARDDYASLIQLWEQWCNISFSHEKQT